jgi:putative lipoic acid-binding regulatory protein
MSKKIPVLESQSSEETLFEFPCEFPIKAMGKTCSEMEIAVVEIMNRHVPDLGEGAIRMRPSSKGTYTAITVTIQAHSKAQLDAIYMELTACEYISFAI